MEEVQPESPTRYMLPDQSSEEKSTCLIDNNSPTTYPASTKKRKRLVKKEKAEKKPKTKKIKQEPEGKTFHEVPPIVENGGIVEVQVLEEGEIFDPDAFLDELAQQWHPLPPSTPQTSTAPFRNPSPPPQGAQRCCILVLCIRKILYKRKRPTLSTAVGSTTNAPSEIVMSAVEWTM